MSNNLKEGRRSYAAISKRVERHEMLLAKEGVRMALSDNKKLFLFASNPTGRQPLLSLVTEEVTKMLLASEAKYGGNGKVVCEVVLDGNNLTITKMLHSAEL